MKIQEVKYRRKSWSALFSEEKLLHVPSPLALERQIKGRVAVMR